MFCSPATVRHRAASASVRKRTTGATCAQWPLTLLPHGPPPQGPPLDRSVASGRCIFAISNVRQLLAKESVETWVCSPATVHHQAVCANVRNRTTGDACAPRPLVLMTNNSMTLTWLAVSRMFVAFSSFALEFDLNCFYY